ncbi:DUF6543 domain-containing protein [Pseudomonas asplenii]|uniref:dermonecrotic toxin domain-containing protein n=1 Tax=Pseudomonas asplenii TaxID=53407 RepID=UPI0037CBAD40
MTASPSITPSANAADGSVRPPLNRHEAFIESRVPAPLKQPGSACLKALANITPTTPSWYSQASTELRAALEKSQLARCTSQHQLEAILQSITPVELFATPRLQQAIREESGLELEVNSTYFVRRMQDRRPSNLGGLLDFSVGDPKVRSWYWDVSLLEAALHNFSADEASKPPASGDAFITHDHHTAEVQIAAYDRSRELALRPERFAALCRKLDLGQGYQDHLNAQLNPADATRKAQVRQTWTKHLHNELAEAVHLARMQALIPDDAYQALLQWLDGHADIRLDNQRLRPWRLRMLGIDLSEIVFLRPESGPTPWRCLVYIPGDDAQSVRHYASSAAFMIELRTRLHSARYRRAFSRFVAVRDQPAFFSALKKRLDPADRHDLWDDYSLDPDLRVGLDLVELAPRVGAWPTLETFLKDQCELNIGRLLGDARVVAVPTDDEDRAARTARLLAVTDAALDLLNLLVFIPGLGQVMLLAMGTRMLHEVYSGIEAWEAGETRQAWAHLLGVAMNAAFVGGVGAALSALDTSAFIDALIPVSVRQGITRLWKADLGPYRHPPPQPALTRPNRLGLHDGRNGRYLRLEESDYLLRPDPSRPGRYRARHTRAHELLNPYAMEFRSNGAGAWRHELDTPLDWTDERLFQRLGPDAASLDEQTAKRLLHITGIDGDVLRATHHNGWQPPALLDDSLVRFALDRELARLVRRLRGDGNASGTPDELHMVLQLLTSDPVWPRGKVLQLLNDGGRVIQKYPANAGAEVTRIEVNWPGLDADGLLRQVLSKLDERDIRVLLREEFGQGTLSLSARVTALRRRLAGDALKRRADLFESHYRHRTRAATDEPGTAVLRRDFPGLPEPLVQELARQANSLERQHLEKSRVPLRLAEEARYYLRAARLARLYEPLYLDSVSQAEAHRIVLPMLGKLPGWSNRVRLEIRDGHFDGPLLDSCGPQSAAISKVLVKDAGQYEAHDDVGLSLHGPDDLYASILHALPDAERAALGFPHVGQGAALKQELRALPPFPREELARLQALPSIKPGFVPPMRLADGRIGYRLSGRTAGGQRSYAIGRLARELYPQLTIAEVETLHGLRELSLGEAISRLRALQEEYRALENGLDSWVGESTDPTDHGRLRWATQIRRCWRRETDRAIDNEGDPIVLNPDGTPLDGYELTLTGYPVDRPPSLSVPLAHVAELQLRGILLPDSTELNGFLGLFPNLQRLNLSGNLLTRLPAALEQLTQLRHLELRNNQIVITPATAPLLIPLTRLETLNLESNPELSLLPDLSPLTRLRCLYLRDTGLSTFPPGYEQLPELRRLDLRDNRISQVPEAVFGMSTARQRLNMTINLDDNLIPVDLHRRIDLYRQQTGIDLGLEPLIESDEPSEWSSDSRPQSNASAYHNRWGSPSPVTRDSQPWLDGLATTEQQARRDVWLRLASDDIEASEAFFKVLADLRQSADYLRDNGAHRPALRERVWRMVKAAEQDSVLRKRLFLLANRAVNTTGPLIEADTCEDGMTVTFDDMGLDVLLHEAQSLPLEEREAPLLRLARGKVRLAQVKQSAHQLIESRKARHETVHEAEIHLAMRIGLADRLELPWQARSMLYTDEANVDKHLLEQTSQAVLAEERLPGELARRLLEQPFWEQYLETRYGPTRLKAPREQRDEMIGALDDLLDAQREWFTGSDLDTGRKAELQQTISQSARTLGLMQSEVFIQAMKDSAYKDHAERIARTYRRELAQLTEELRHQHGL